MVVAQWYNSKLLNLLFKGLGLVAVDTGEEVIAFKINYILMDPFVRVKPFRFTFKLTGQEPVAMAQW